MQNAFAGITFQGGQNIKWGWKKFSRVGTGRLSAK